MWGRNNKRAETYALISDHLQWILNISLSDSVVSSVISLKKTATHLHPRLQGNSCISDTSGNAPSVLKGRYRF